MSYPDTKAIVSGYFKPLDKTRCLVCGAELHGAESTCSQRCFDRMCNIQRGYPLEHCNKLIDAARAANDPRLEG